MSRGSWEVLGRGDKSELGVGGNETLQTRGVPPSSCLVLVGHHKVTEVGSGWVSWFEEEEVWRAQGLPYLLRFCTAAHTSTCFQSGCCSLGIPRR